MIEWKTAIWLTSDEREALRKAIAERLTNSDTHGPDDPALIEKVLAELGVAAARFNSGRVSPDSLRSALGQAKDAIPVRLSRNEALVVLRLVHDVPISVIRKFEAVTS